MMIESACRAFANMAIYVAQRTALLVGVIGFMAVSESDRRAAAWITPDCDDY